MMATGQKMHEEAEWTMSGADEAVGLHDRQVRELAWSQWCTNMDGSDDLLPDDAPFKYFLKDKWLEDSVTLARASAPGIIQWRRVIVRTSFILCRVLNDCQS